MSGSQTFQRRTRQALEEHEQIHFYLDQISLTLEGLAGGVSDVEPMRRLAAQLEGLKERLEEHHQSEESGGLFQTILEALPESRLEISRLVEQHAEMIKILEMARIHAQCGEPGELDGLRTDLQDFLAAFRRHEQVEEQLLQRLMARERQIAD